MCGERYWLVSETKMFNVFFKHSLTSKDTQSFGIPLTGCLRNSMLLTLLLYRLSLGLRLVSARKPSLCLAVELARSETLPNILATYWINNHLMPYIFFIIISRHNPFTVPHLPNLLIWLHFTFYERSCGQEKEWIAHRDWFLSFLLTN